MSEIYIGSQWDYDVFSVNKARVSKYAPMLHIENMILHHYHWQNHDRIPYPVSGVILACEEGVREQNFFYCLSRFITLTALQYI